MKNIKIGFVSLGCCKNQLDTEVMLSVLSDEGFEITNEEADADVIIINTCAFINDAKQEAIDNILDIAWFKKHRHLKKIIVTGCLAERYREQIFEQMPEVDALVGVGSIKKIAEAVRSSLSGNRYSSFEDKNTSELGGGRMLTTPPFAAYLKIAEGCDNRCTYCAIPLIRGKFRSRTIEDIVEEAKLLDEDGCKELSLIAQDTSRYGLDLYGKYMLPELIRRICAETKIPWIRLLYCYPDKITDELIDEMANNDRVVKYIDLPIQHINNDILKAMNRHGNRATIEDAIKRLRDKIPDITLRTTVIAGFPGETEAQFEELCDFIKETRFDRLGAFAYSREEDTPAYDFPDQKDEQTKQDRCDKIMALQAEISAALNEKKLHKTVTVLCEGFDGASGAYVGRSEADAPDVDGKIFFDLDRGKELHKEGDFVKVRITDFYDYDLVGISKKG
jgi:ribosomal protein S12 methylthiotransferase